MATNSLLFASKEKFQITPTGAVVPTVPVADTPDSGAVITSEPARQQFDTDVERVETAELQFASSDTATITPTGAITFKSPNVAFQSLVDQTNQLIESTKESGAITPETQDKINQVSNFEAEKTQAIADAREAIDKKDATASREATARADEIEAQQKSIVTQLIEEMREARAGFIESLAPTERETELRRSLRTLRTERQLLPLELRQEGISAAGIEARQVGDERVRAIQEGNLLFELGLEQEARQFKTLAAEKQLGFIQDDLDLQFKIEEGIRAEEKNILKEARALRKESLSAMSDIVESFEGLAFEDLDAETQAELLDTAKNFGIPVNLLSAAMKNAKQQQIFDRSIKERTREVAETRERRLGEEEEKIPTFEEFLTEAQEEAAQTFTQKTRDELRKIYDEEVAKLKTGTKAPSGGALDFENL
ncbi:hypothetical protein LCGC14_1503080 [marine sediment metagenome]|uniref:Uncharacterized protein n=1 Tax=marine sediment metagenome TaxID=412755 RepID=A0A0F9M506_9ZZZZ